MKRMFLLMGLVVVLPGVRSHGPACDVVGRVRPVPRRSAARGRPLTERPQNGLTTQRNEARRCILCRVVRVVDGDTVHMKLEPGNWQLGEPVTPVLGANTQHPATVRLAGIDAPELTQPFGPEAKTVLTASTLGRIVRLEYEGTDRYGRILGDVFTGDIWVNLQLVRDGLAWRYPRCKATRIRRAEQNARRAGLGLWADPQPLAPWLFRKGRNGRKKAQKAQKPREGMLEELGRAA